MTPVVLTATLLAVAMTDGRALARESQVPAGATQESSRAVAFVRSFSQALARRDRTAVAGMVRYPATAVAGGLALPIDSRESLLRMYDAVFTSELRCLADASVARGTAAMRVEPGVVVFAEGRVRAEEVDGAFRITRIDVPPAAAEGGGAASRTERVTLRAGRAQYSGRLYADGVDTYILTVGKGAVVQARIEGFAPRSAAVRVIDPGGRSLDRPALPSSSGAPGAPPVWNGTIRESGDHRIQVVRLASACTPSFTYLLSITVR